MIYKAVEVIWIYSAGRVGIEGTLRGSRGPKNGIRYSSQISTTAPIFLLSNYFRQKYLEIASCAVSLLNNIAMVNELYYLKLLLGLFSLVSNCLGNIYFVRNGDSDSTR